MFLKHLSVKQCDVATGDETLSIGGKRAGSDDKPADGALSRHEAIKFERNGNSDSLRSPVFALDEVFFGTLSLNCFYAAISCAPTSLFDYIALFPKYSCSELFELPSR